MNGPEPDSARLEAALRASAEHARPGIECPPADRIWAAARLELPLEERLVVIDHTSECPVCAEAWRLALEFRPNADETAASPPPARSGTPKHSPAWVWASAAALVVAAGAGLVLLNSGTRIEPALRDPRPGSVQSSIAPGAALPRESVTLRWSGGPAGARYDLTVTTTGLDVLVATRGLERPEFRIPPERLADLPPGTRLLWRVVARGPDGATEASPTFEVVVE